MSVVDGVSVLLVGVRVYYTRRNRTVHSRTKHSSSGSFSICRRLSEKRRGASQALSPAPSFCSRPAQMFYESSRVPRARGKNRPVVGSQGISIEREKRRFEKELFLQKKKRKKLWQLCGRRAVEIIVDHLRNQSRFYRDPIETIRERKKKSLTCQVPRASRG